MLQVRENPSMLPPGTNSLVDLPGPWWVAHTKGRFEKAFAWDLVRRGIDYFLPMTERVCFSGGRKRRVLLPLFPSYVFLSGSSDDRYTALTTNRLCQVIEVKDQECLIRELSGIERALFSGEMVSLYSAAPLGGRCQIRGGPLEGVEGIVVEYKKRARVVLKVTAMGRGALLEIDLDLVEPLD